MSASLLSPAAASASPTSRPAAARAVALACARGSSHLAVLTYQAGFLHFFMHFLTGLQNCQKVPVSA
jgi:hypothetical protein